METDAQAKKEFSNKSGQFWLWLGLLLPTVAWLLQLQTVYLLSQYGCATGNFWPNHLASVIALMLSIAGGFLSWRNWREAGGETSNKQAGTMPRSNFMALLGMLTGALFTLLIFAQWLPTILGVPCEK